MKQGIYRIVHNRPLSLDNKVWEMTLEGDTKALTSAGQFVNIALTGHFLRRPISVSEWSDTSLTIVYKVVGEGTAEMREMVEGQKLDLLTGLGNGFSIPEGINNPVVVGGGVGVPPLVGLVRQLLRKGLQPTVVMGFNTSNEVFYVQKFAEQPGVETILATVDGSVGLKGFVTDALTLCNVDFDYLYCCGPLPMLRALYDFNTTDGQYSFEERMGCGFGACMGCTHPTTDGYKRICKDGPVLKRGEIVFE